MYLQWERFAGIAIAPVLLWLASKAMRPLVRRIERMPESRLKRVLLFGRDQ